MLIFFVFVKLLSLMTNTRERVADHPERENCGSGHARAGQRPDQWVWDICGEYAGCGKYSHGEGIVTQKAISFHNGLILPFDIYPLGTVG